MDSSASQKSVEISNSQLTKSAPDNSMLESALIIECSRSTLLAENKERLHFILKKDLNWNYIFNVSQRNAVLPLVSYNLLQHFKQKISPDIVAKLNGYFQEQMKQNMFLTNRLISIVESLKAENIVAVPFKGPVLALQAYKNLALRRYIDLDILVKPSDFERAVRHLTANGYSTDDDSWQKTEDWFIGGNKDINLFSADGSVKIELHWKLSGFHFALPLELESLWERLEKISIGGRQISVLPFSDLLIYLCLHGSRHGWERMAWICDVKELIESQTEIDWKQIARQAEKLGCSKVLALGLRLVHDFFGSNIPGSMFFKSDAALKSISERIRRKTFEEFAAQMEISDRYLYHLELKERRWDKWKLHLHYSRRYLRIIFRPNRMDKELFRLPKNLTPLYYVLRPVRLVMTRLIKKKSAADKA
jgi:hypothetical protein